MKNLIRPNGSRAARLAAAGIVVAAAIAAAAGLAGRGYASPTGKAYKASYPHKERFERPTLRHGHLIIRGTRAGELLAPRQGCGVR